MLKNNDKFFIAFFTNFYFKLKKRYNIQKHGITKEILMKKAEKNTRKKIQEFWCIEQR